MKKLLLAALVLTGLAGCAKNDSDPTPTPSTTPSGHYTAGTAYLQFEGAGLYAPPSVFVNNVQANFSGGNVTVSLGECISARVSPATTAYTLSLPILAYAAQSGAVGQSDSLVSVTATSFTWIHYTGLGGSSSGGDIRIFANFTR